MEASDQVSLGLRLSLLESLTLGEAAAVSDRGATQLLSLYNTSLLLRSDKAQSQFLQSIDRYKSIVQFVNDYKDNNAYLQPSNLMASSNYTDLADSNEQQIGKGGPREKKNEEEQSLMLSTNSIISLLLESDSDLRQLERDLRMCESYYERDVAGAGKLAECEPLLPRLAAIKEQANLTGKEEIELETRVMQLMEKYTNQIDAMSKLFIQWDQVLAQTEDALTRLERSRR